MMGEQQVMKEINDALVATGAPDGQVIYLEGKSDPDLFFAFLGLPTPPTYQQGKTLVKGLSDKEGAAGNYAVRHRMDVAQKMGLTTRVFGIVDGDGQDWSTLVANFDPPHAGPLYSWKAYSIESLLPQTGWPSSWGAVPNWQTELTIYTPYVALNRLHSRLFDRLETLGVRLFRKPIHGKPLDTVADVQSALNRDKHLLATFDVAAEFAQEVAVFQNELTAALPRGLALLNGKWLLSHFLPEKLKLSPDACLQQWVSYIAAQGGLPEVRDLWQRITGSAP